MSNNTINSDTRQRFTVAATRLNDISSQATILKEHAGFPKDYKEFDAFCERMRQVVRRDSILLNCA